MTFGGWLRQALAAFQLDDEAYTSYVEAIMKEEGDGEQDKKEAVLEFLSAATDADLSAFGDEMIAKWKEEQEKESKSRQNKQKQEEATVSSVEDKNSMTQEPVKENRFDKQKVLSKEERKRREALLAQYGYESEQLNENGDIVVAAESSAPLTATLGVEANTNASRIAEEEQRKRTAAKEKYQKKVQREKELLAIDKQRKEKRKQRTQKKEKRRGPG
ncbi:hypothetical protein QOT17_018590 [Balamuthia mandrillaris]